MKLTSVFSFVLFLIACNNYKSDPSPKSPPSEQILANQSDSSDLEKVERWQATDYRNENWHPETGQYYFSETWTWEFYNEFLPAKDKRRKGEMSIYVDPASGTLLLNKDATSYQDEMTDWIIIKPEGIYMIGYSDEFGKKQIQHQHMSDFDDYDFNLKSQKEDFKKHLHFTGEYETFGTNDYEWETFYAAEYKMSYEMTSDTNTMFITELPFSCRALYLANELSPDFSLPTPMDYGYILSENMLVVSDQYMNANKKMGFKLLHTSPSDFFLDINEYKASSDH